MSSLQSCTDALLQQKAVQSSNHEHLEQQLLELERGRRAACRRVRALIDDVQRRARDLQDLQSGARRLVEYLGQGKLKLNALMLAGTEAARRQRGLEELITRCEDQWAGQPARMTQLLRALQERRACVTASREMHAVLLRTYDVLRVLCDAHTLRRRVSGAHEAQAATQAACIAALDTQSAATTRRRDELSTTQATLSRRGLVLIGRQGDLARRRGVAACEMDYAALATQELRGRCDLCHTALLWLSDGVDHIVAEHALARQAHTLQQGTCSELRQAAHDAAAQRAALYMTQHTQRTAATARLAARREAQVALQKTVNAGQVRAAALRLARRACQCQLRLLALLRLAQLDLRRRQGVLHAGWQATRQEASTTLCGLRTRHEAVLRKERLQSQCREALRVTEAEESLMRKALCAEATRDADALVTLALASQPREWTPRHGGPLPSERGGRPTHRAPLVHGSDTAGVRHKRTRVTVPADIPAPLGPTDERCTDQPLARRTYPFLVPRRPPATARLPAVHPVVEKHSVATAGLTATLPTPSAPRGAPSVRDANARPTRTRVKPPLTSNAPNEGPVSGAGTEASPISPSPLPRRPFHPAHRNGARPAPPLQHTVATAEHARLRASTLVASLKTPTMASARRPAGFVIADGGDDIFADIFS